MTLTDEQRETIAALHDILRSMHPDEARRIREAYNKTMDGLDELTELLKVADARQNQTAGPLLPEHLYAMEALDTMKQSLLGAAFHS